MLRHAHPKGFSLRADYITPEREREMVAYVESLGGAPVEGRTVFRFGHDYNAPFAKIGDVPEELHVGIFSRGADSVTANVYEPGAKITAHIDSLAFAEPIYILSLLNDARMRFTSPIGVNLDVELPRRSLAVLAGEARTQWQHAVEDMDGRRISIVYRKLKQEHAS